MGIVFGRRAWVGHRPRLKAFRSPSPPRRGFRPAARFLRPYRETTAVIVHTRLQLVEEQVAEKDLKHPHQNGTIRRAWTHAAKWRIHILNSDILTYLRQLFRGRSKKMRREKE